MIFPLISVIIPCRNERHYIARCLDSIIDGDYPKERLEVLVVDGMSDDGTREIVGQYSQRYPFITVLENAQLIVPVALNLGIKQSSGDIIMRMDAHNRYEKEYISKCVRYLSVSDADNVGGLCVTVPARSSEMAKAIAIGMSHPFGVGNSHFRIGTKEPRYVDTVPFGCYRREVFKRIGYFDEDLIRNQDDEFNLRLIKNGGRILLVPSILSYYFARDTIGKLARMYYQYGRFKPLVALKLRMMSTWRQLIPPLFLGVLFISGIGALATSFLLWVFLGVVAAYGLANIAASLLVLAKGGGRSFLVCPVVFASMHFSYGWGYLVGIWDYLIVRKHKKNRAEDVSLTR